MCERSNGISSKLLGQIRKKITDVEKAFGLPPGCEIKKTYLVHSSGKIIFERPKLAPSDHSEVSDLVHTLYDTSRQLAMTVAELDLSSVHVKGTGVLYSCFQIDGNYLALCCSAPPELLDGINTPAIDDRMAPHINELKLILDHVMVAPS